MAIEGLGQYGGLYNNYTYPSIKSVDVETVKQQDEAAKKNSDLQNTTESLSQSYSQPLSIEDNRSKIANLEDISLTFNQMENFDYLGSDSSIESLDMEKAISDMQKDQVLQQYQYFIGSTQNLVSANEDGVVLQK